mmetsp:Transcript_36780/g.84934  ORF Transcript_36780/g.84934 Transcript_36780/m.84934 type:complete len:247 (+) Transcript_36780:1181-1921(+)
MLLESYSCGKDVACFFEDWVCALLPLCLAWLIDKGRKILVKSIGGVYGFPHGSAEFHEGHMVRPHCVPGRHNIHQFRSVSSSCVHDVHKGRGGASDHLTCFLPGMGEEGSLKLVQFGVVGQGLHGSLRCALHVDHGFDSPAVPLTCGCTALCPELKERLIVAWGGQARLLLFTKLRHVGQSQVGFIGKLDVVVLDFFLDLQVCCKAAWRHHMRVLLNGLFQEARCNLHAIQKPLRRVWARGTTFGL